MIERICWQIKTSILRSGKKVKSFITNTLPSNSKSKYPELKHFHCRSVHKVFQNKGQPQGDDFRDKV